MPAYHSLAMKVQEVLASLLSIDRMFMRHLTRSNAKIDIAMGGTVNIKPSIELLSRLLMSQKTMAGSLSHGSALYFIVETKAAKKALAMTLARTRVRVGIDL